MDGNHIAGFDLIVSDLDRSADFYTRGLGLLEKAKEDHGDLHEIMVGGEVDTTVIVLVTNPERSAPSLGDADSVKIVLVVGDASATYERAIAEGGTAEAAPKTIDAAKVTFAELRDPDGYLIQLVEHLA